MERKYEFEIGKRACWSAPGEALLPSLPCGRRPHSGPGASIAGRHRRHPPVGSSSSRTREMMMKRPRPRSHGAIKIKMKRSPRLPTLPSPCLISTPSSRNSVPRATPISSQAPPLNPSRTFSPSPSHERSSLFYLGREREREHDTTQLVLILVLLLVILTLQAVSDISLSINCHAESLIPR